MARKHISTFILRRMEEIGLTKQEAAKRLNMKYGSFTAIIRRGSIADKNLPAFSRVFEIDTASLRSLARMADGAKYNHPWRKISTGRELGLPMKFDILPLMKEIPLSNLESLTLENFLRYVSIRAQVSGPIADDLLRQFLAQ